MNLLPLVISAALGTTAFAADFVKVNGDSACSSGFQELTLNEALAQKNEVCQILGTWDIARLAEGGSMDGPGYNCKIRAVDGRGLGTSLCRRVEQIVRQVGDRTCPTQYSLVSPDLARVHQNEFCQKLGTWDIVRLADGGSIDGPGYGCGIRDQDTRSLGHSLCAHFTVAKVNKDGPCPAGQRLVSPEFARQNVNAICANLGTWDIVRLSEGGSMDGLAMAVAFD